VDDPERVIAEALRAQAARTPLPSSSVEPAAVPAGSPVESSGEATQINAAPGLGLAGSGYGLLSGNDLGLTLPPSAPAATTLASETSRIEPTRRVPGWAILLLALALGLAAGALVGLVTLL
jgi:hypothetical protein